MLRANSTARLKSVCLRNHGGASLTESYLVRKLPVIYRKNVNTLCGRTQYGRLFSAAPHGHMRSIIKKTLKMATAVMAMSISLFSVQSGAAGAQVFTPEQQARIGEIASDYLVAHPDVLLEVSKKLQARQQALQQQAYVQSALKTHRLLMQLDGVPVKGPADSKVIVTEFFDYECIACSMMAPVMEKVMAANAGVRFAFRD